MPSIAATPRTLIAICPDNDQNSESKMNRKPSFNPYWVLIHDAYQLLALSEAARDQGTRSMLARASTQHTLSSLHAAANSVFANREIRVEREASLYRKFDLLVHQMDLGELPEDDEKVLGELDDIARILNYPEVATATIEESGEKKRIEYQRTELKKLNRECIGWVPEYAACVLILGNRFLHRLFYRYCEFDRDQIEVLLGHHESREDSYYSSVDQSKIEVTREISRQLANHPRLAQVLESPRWRFERSFLEFDLL